MPYRRRRKPIRRRRRKTYRRRNRPASNVVKTVNGFPDVLYTTLKYTQRFQFTTDPTLQRFRGNGLFDPDFTGVGHQPFYYLQLATIYDRYEVFASSVSIQFHNNQINPIYVTLLPVAESSTAATDPFTAKEKPYARSIMLGVEGSAKASSKIYHSMSTKKIRGERFLDSDYSSLSTSNPARQWFWNLHMARADATTSLVLTAVVTISYKCCFRKRNNDVPQS